MTACKPVVQSLNLFALAVIVGCICFYLYPSWPSVKDGSFFTANIGQTAQAVGAICSLLALLVFPLLWWKKTWTPLAILACLLAIADVVSYIIWNWKGAAGILCDGAKSAADEASLTGLANEYIQCDAEWMSWVISALIFISGSLQLSVAFSAVPSSSSGGGCGGPTICCCDCNGVGGFSLGRRRKPPPHAVPAHSLDKRSSRRSRRSRRRDGQRGDEEAQLPLHEMENGMSSSEEEEDVPPPTYDRRTMRYGAQAGDEKDSTRGGGGRASLSLAGAGSLSDQEEKVGLGRREGAGRF